MRLRAFLAPEILPAYASSAARVLRRRLLGPRRYPGDAVAICRAIVDACWTGDYLAASAGHFRQFWMRDLGFSARSLIHLGQGPRVEASLACALETWARRGRVTTTIFGGRRPADVYELGCDSLPLLLATIEAGGFESLARRHAGWLRFELERYAAEVIDARTGLVRADRLFSSHRDTVRTRSSCYANTMLVVLDGVLRRTGWFPSPVSDSISDRLIDAFWRADHFSDRQGRDELTGDANTFPFWTGAVPDSLGLDRALAALERAGLTRPLPLRYAERRDAAAEDPIQRLFVPDYQGTAVWTSLGAIYLALLARVDPGRARAGLAAYARLVERDGTLREVYTTGLRPYRGRLGLFLADEGMLWASILLAALTDDAPDHQSAHRPEAEGDATAEAERPR
jgi:hypothetical protein